MRARPKPQRTEEPAVSLTALASSLRLLADPTRLRILDCLLDGVLCNCNIKERLGLPMNLISHHVKMLKEAGLVRAERDPSDARWIYYQIEPEALAKLQSGLAAALNPARLKPREPMCGPAGCFPPAIRAPETHDPPLPRRTP